MKDAASPRVVGLGALNADRILRVERLLDDGESAIQDGGIFPGGSSANTTYGLARLGISTGFFGAVGDDHVGKLLLHDFRKVGTDIGHVKVKRGEPSGTVLCISSPCKRALYVLPGANGALDACDLDMGYINRAGYLHLSSFVDDAQFYLSRDIVEKLSAKVKLSFSPGALYVSRGIEELKPFLKRTDVLFINREEIETLTTDEFRSGTRLCLAAGCKTIVVTLGNGFKQTGQMVVAYVCDSKNEWYIDAGKPAKSEIVETTGAGDAFAAGFLFGLLEKKDLPTCGKIGNCVARLSLKCSGARRGLPTRRQLEKHFLAVYGASL